MNVSVFTELLAPGSLFVMAAHMRQFCLQLWHAANLISDECPQKKCITSSDKTHVADKGS